MSPIVRAASRALATALMSGFAIGAVAAQGTVPPPPSDVTAAKAYSLLERTCAGCHQSGKLDGRAPSAGIDNILAIGEIARDPALVRPGLPDASRIYNIALTRELHHDAFNDPAVGEPTASEVQALRDWIGELPAATRGCPAVPPVDPSAHWTAIDGLISALPPESARQTRFVSLAHLRDACPRSAELERFRQAVGHIVMGLAMQHRPTRSARPGYIAVDRERLILAVSLTEMGWRPEQWETLVAAYPLRGANNDAARYAQRVTASAVPVVAADWLAEVVLSGAGVPGNFGATETTASAARAGLDDVAALAHAWRRPAGLERAAADLSVSPAALGIMLAGVGGDSVVAARQLRSGDLASRASLDRLYPLLLRGEAPTPAEDAAHRRLEIALSADRPAYKAGDTATFSVVSTRDCHLTLVGVDRAGRAIILFPNELEPDNQITAGQVREVPGAGANYRFRFKERGRETIVAICSLTRRAPVGVVHDYDRLRFTVLGDWQLFLREPPEMKEARRDDAATDVPRPQVRQRRRGGGETKAPAVESADVQTRTAISITIE